MELTLGPRVVEFWGDKFLLGGGQNLVFWPKSLYSRQRKLGVFWGDKHVDRRGNFVFAPALNHAKLIGTWPSSMLTDFLQECLTVVVV